MTETEILNLKKAVVDSNAKNYRFSLELVPSGDFNGALLIFSEKIPVEEIKDNVLRFFNPMFDDKKALNFTVALAADVKGIKYFIVDSNGDKTVKTSSELKHLIESKLPKQDGWFYSYRIE